MSQPLHELTLHQAHQFLRDGQISSVELTKAVLDRIEAVEDKVKAYVTATPDLALEQAEAADKAISEGMSGPLIGVPMMLKDNICTRGVCTTCSSRMLENFVPPYDAHVTERLNAVGSVLVGKGNLDEFAMGSSTENSAFSPTRNPWDLERVPGGSSGGPAAAVAAGEAVYSLGSDTGGSIRQPASFCGVVGLKPTYGLVSRYGLVAFGSSLDQIGPITRDITDCALALNAIAGHDPRDSTSAPYNPPDYTQALVPDIRGLRIGVPKEYFVEGTQQDVADVMERALAKLEELGAEVDSDVSLPHTKYALAVYYIIAPSEASANLARYDGVKYGFSAQDAESMWDAMEKTRQHGFGAEVKRRIMLGTYALSAGYYDAYYLKAQKVRTLISQEFQAAFQRCDALVSAVSPTLAFRLGEKVADPVQMYRSDILTIPVNIAGIPGISVPAGMVDGLPVGLQVMGPHFGEETLLRIA
ncbi:MAG: Asp-tRNA(Asn)/Glu-tRNA(Gln) amidotransferase subunit GatA, partial [Dehalococcoidia bacterium]